MLHWSDALFVSVFEGMVFAQMPQIRRQAPVAGEHRIELSRTPQRCTGSLGSDGMLEDAFDTDQPPKRVRVRAIWSVDPRVPRAKLPAVRARGCAASVALAVHDGVVVHRRSASRRMGGR